MREILCYAVMRDMFVSSPMWILKGSFERTDYVDTLYRLHMLEYYKT